jgi:hypothetical protein
MTAEPRVATAGATSMPKATAPAWIRAGRDDWEAPLRGSSPVVVEASMTVSGIKGSESGCLQVVMKVD